MVRDDERGIVGMVGEGVRRGGCLFHGCLGVTGMGKASRGRCFIARAGQEGLPRGTPEAVAMSEMPLFFSGGAELIRPLTPGLPDKQRQNRCGSLGVGVLLR